MAPEPVGCEYLYDVMTKDLKIDPKNFVIMKAGGGLVPELGDSNGIITLDDGVWISREGIEKFMGDEEVRSWNVQLDAFDVYKDVIFNGPATVIRFNDGSKEVAKCSDSDIFDPEIGLMMALLKHAYGPKVYSEFIAPIAKGYREHAEKKPLTTDDILKWINIMLEKLIGDGYGDITL